MLFTALAIGADVIGRIARGELDDAFANFADGEGADREIGVINTVEPGRDIRIGVGLANLAEPLVSRRNLMSPVQNGP